MVFVWCRRERENNNLFYLSSPPDEDHESKALVFLIVLYVSLYRSGEYISLELLYFVNLTSICSPISFCSPFFGEEFSGEIPKKFRSLSVLVYESGSKSEKVIILFSTF